MLWLRIIIIGTLALLSTGVTAEELEKCGPYDGVDLTNDPVLLERILSDHKKWLADSEQREDDPRRANLCGADLAMIDLSWSCVPLENVNLSKADLSGANLSKADLSGADLSESDLVMADLSEADLVMADLSKTDLLGVNLTKTYLTRANLTKADLVGANLSEAYLVKADLSEADLWGANLTKTDLTRANLTKADLTRANLSGAYLVEANLTEANLWEADLNEADLERAILREAKLVLTGLTNARLTDVHIFGARYEARSVPSIDYLIGIQGLSDVRFDDGKQAGLVLLRTALKEAGLRKLEREATYAIERGKTSHARGLEKWLKLIFFEWTSDYGLAYGRPLLILLSLLFPFAAVYYFPIAGHGASRLYLVWSDERIEDDEPVGKPERRIEPLVIDSKKNHLRIVGFALYFSLLSAFHIGWRDLNVGNWIARIQPREYSLRAKGWVRTVSGIQSLISIYLLALWALIYFGRPFE